MSQLEERDLKANAQVGVKYVRSSCDANFLMMSSLQEEPFDQMCIFFLHENVGSQVAAPRGEAGSLASPICLQQGSRRGAAGRAGCQHPAAARQTAGSQRGSIAGLPPPASPNAARPRG